MRYKYKKLLMVLLCFSMIFPQILLPLENRVIAASIGKCTANSLNIRSGPGTNYSKVLVDGAEAFLTKDQEVTILGEENGWYQINATFLGKKVEGYCLGTYIKLVNNNEVSPTPTPTNTPSPAEEITITYNLSIPAKISANELNIRKEASSNSEKLATLVNQASVTILGESISGLEKWYYISTKLNGNTIKGYVLSNYVTCTFSTGFYAKITTDNVTLLSEADSSSTKLNVGGNEVNLKSGTEVWVSAEKTVTGKKWFLVGVKYNGTSVRGYVLSENITLLGKKITSSTTTPLPTGAPTPTETPSPAPTKVPSAETSTTLNLPALVTASQLNLRKEASTTSTKLGVLTLNTSVNVISVKKSGSEIWYYVSTNVNGKSTKGYVLSNYIAFTFKSGFYGQVTANSVTLKKAAGSSGSVIGSDGSAVALSKGTNVWISWEKTVDNVKWFYVGITLNGKATRGYVKASEINLTGKKVVQSENTTPAVTPTPVPPSSNKPIDGKEDFQIPATVTANTLNLRKDATTSSAKLATLTLNTKVTVLNEVDVNTETWYRIATQINGKTTIGYVLSNYVKLTLKESVDAEVGSTSVKPRIEAKSSAGYVKTKSGNVVTLKAGSSITILAEQTVGATKWFKVRAKVGNETVEGFVASNSINFSVKRVEVTPSPTVTPTPTPTPTVPPTATPTPTVIPSPTPTPPIQVFSGTGRIKDASSLAVKQNAGYSSDFVKDENGNAIIIYEGKEVTIHGSAYADSYTWYHLSFEHGGVVYYGYVNKTYVQVDEGSITEGDSSIPGNTETNPGNNNIDFETKLNNEGFPESYKVLLRQLHQQYPNWEFTAYHTGLDWNTVIENQGIAGKNLITNSKGIAWKSLESGAYNWKTDSFIVYDGSSWVTASKEAIAYYMDPRNFLTANGIFQFEHLAYKAAYQNLAGVENILKNTPMYQTNYTYTDDSGNMRSISYGTTFMEAAKYSGVSPYHLASRVKQEVVIGTNKFSNSVSGTVPGFEDLYNFYNIGAYHSTAAGGAIANGLKYARNGSTNATLNINSLIPWSNRYRSIVGGAYIIGNSYINRGQDTIYLQKFNVTPTSTHSHQYMANVEAPFSESKKVYAAYTDVSTSPIVFSIPVYLNMPSTVCPAPGIAYNPNNWLKTLKITDDSGTELPLTPTFDLSKDQEYYLVLDSSKESITVSATTVSSKASISGTGKYTLQYGENLVVISVTAENGDVRNYIITIVKEN